MAMFEQDEPIDHPTLWRIAPVRRYGYLPEKAFAKPNLFNPTDLNTSLPYMEDKGRPCTDNRQS